MAKSDDKSPQPNALHSPFSTLPPEILSLVFQHACAIVDLNQRHGLPDLPPSSLPPRDKRTQFIMNAVSVHWRQVLFSTPHIWTSVDLIISPTTVNEASAVLQAFFTYSGQLPLAIAIRFTSSWRYSTEFLVDASSDAVLYQNTLRIRELHLCDMSDVWTGFLPSLSNLANLSIKYTRRETRPVPIRSQCSRLTLWSPPKNIRIYYSDITVLHMHSAPLEFCFQMLLRDPNLIEYRSRQRVEVQGWVEEITLPTDSFVLPRMETFEWSVDTQHPIDVAMLQHIRMPALRKLIWVEEDLADLGVADSRDAFFRNLPLSLVDFHFHNDRVDSIQPTFAFDLVCDSFNLEHLTFSGVSGPFLDHVFEGLTPPLSIGGNQQTMKLPKLKAITIKDFIPTLLNQDKILQMLEHRFLNADALNQEPFRLDFSHQVAFSPQFKEILNEMVGRGLKVEVRVGPKLVDWL